MCPWLMRGNITLATWVIHETTDEEILKFLKLYRDRRQWIVDCFFGFRKEIPVKEFKVPSQKKLNEFAYKQLTEVDNFRAHVAQKLIKYVQSTLKALKNQAKEQKRKTVTKPVFKRLSARFDYYDFEVNWNENKVIIKPFKNKEFIFKLPRTKYFEKFKGLKPKELVLKYIPKLRRFKICIVFEFEVIINEPRSLMLIEQNEKYILYKVVSLDGKLITMNCIPRKYYIRALNHRKIAENYQKRYSTCWRFRPNVLDKIRYHHTRARNITKDGSHFTAKKLVNIAKRYGAWIVDEDLKGLKRYVEQQGSKDFRWRFARICYAKLQHCLRYKTILNGLYFFTVDSEGNSSTCARCGSRLIFKTWKLGYCPKCKLYVHRDFNALENIFKKAVKKLPEVFKELDKVLKKFEKAREAGKKGALKRWKKPKTEDEAPKMTHSGAEGLPNAGMKPRP